MSEPRRLYTAQPVRNEEPAGRIEIALSLTKKASAPCRPELLWVAMCSTYTAAYVSVSPTGQPFVSPTGQALRLIVSPY